MQQTKQWARLLALALALATAAFGAAACGTSGATSTTTAAAAETTAAPAETTTAAPAETTTAAAAAEETTTAAPATTAAAAEETTAAATEAASGSSGPKVLTIGNYMNVTTLLPWVTTSDGDYYVLSQIYATLVNGNKVREYKGQLATEWGYSEDGLTWTFKIRDNEYWHDGNGLYAAGEKVQITADDVKYSFDFVLTTPEASRYSELNDVLESVEVVDPTTIAFHMKKIDALFLTKVSNTFIIPKKAFDEGFDLNDFPVGSGAYKFVRHVTDTEVVLEKNPNYFIEPGLDQIVYKIIPDRSVIAIALQNEEIDIASALLPQDLSAVGSKDYLTITDSGSSSARWMGFNCAKGIFTDVDLRRAVAMAINLDDIITALFKNDVGAKLAVKGYGLVPPENPGGKDMERLAKAGFTYDPEGAQALIESKGWTKGSDGVYEKDGQKFSFVLQVGNNDANREKLSVVVSQQLKAIGVDCTARTAEWATHLTDMDAGNLDMYIVGGYGGLDGPWKVMTYDPNTYSPNPGYKNDQVESIMAEAMQTLDGDARAELIAQANEIYINECPTICAWFEYMQVGMNNRVKGFADYYPYIAFPLCHPERNVTVE